jgi:flagellar biosynthesis protein FlhG
VGKSIVVSSLAAALAGAGRRCVIVDADLGGANLHTLFGVSHPRRTLSHFVSGDVRSLAELLVPTSVPNLWLVSGNEALLEMANPRYCHKEKLVRHIRRLEVDDVLIDLGAGSAFNVLDFFLLARNGLVVVTPEATAVENAEHFLRAALYRSLRVVARRPEVRAAIERIRQDRRRRIASAPELVACVEEIDPLAAKLLDERARAFAPLLVVNQVEMGDHHRVGPALAERCREQLGVAAEYAGSLAADPTVREAVARGGPALQLFARSPFSRQIEELARRLHRGELRCESRPARERADPGTRPLPALDLSEPGDYLRRCRTQLGLSLHEMTERTRIRGLADIEEERFASLPPEPYLTGFLLQYARELGVSELETLTASYLDRYRRVEARENPA